MRDLQLDSAVVNECVSDQVCGVGDEIEAARHWVYELDYRLDHAIDQLVATCSDYKIAETKDNIIKMVRMMVEAELEIARLTSK